MLSSCINWVHANVRNVKYVRRYCRSNDKKFGGATHVFKFLKEIYLDDQASESDSDENSDNDDNSKIVLNHENDPEIKYFKSFCKALPLCYPLTLDWTKIPYQHSKNMNATMERGK